MAKQNFGKLPAEYGHFKRSNIVLQSIPYDGTSTWGKGADRGFQAFLEASGHLELYDIETDSEVYTEGIHVAKQMKDFASPKEMCDSTYECAKSLLNTGKFLTFFGGEHSISIGLIKAFDEYYEDLTVLQLDAHADLRPSYQGSAFNHACALHEASKNCNLIQVGIRSMDISEKEHVDDRRIYFAENMVEDDSWIKDSMNLMTDHVYITLDLDVFDPAIMPATGTPEPGGLDWYTVTNYLRRVFNRKNVVGFDLVELAPIDGLRGPQFLAAKLYYKMLSYKFSL